MTKVVIIGTRCGDIRVHGTRDISLKFLQSCVGGYIELATPPELKEKGIEILVNEDGLNLGLDVNKNFKPYFMCGQAVAVAVKRDDFDFLTDAQTIAVLNWFEDLKIYRGERLV